MSNQGPAGFVRIGSLVFARPQSGEPPVINTACPWATDLDDLKKLYRCRYTSGITTRTALLSPAGFAHSDEQHKFRFFGEDEGFKARGSINNLGYSPHGIDKYVEWVERLFKEDGKSVRKPVLISVTGTPDEVDQCIAKIRGLRSRLSSALPPSSSPVGIELNLSCPNIPGLPPPAYSSDLLLLYLRLVLKHAKEDPELTIGAKLPPLVHQDMFDGVIRALERVVQDDIHKSGGESNEWKDRHPLSFLTCTNTLGNGCILLPNTTNESNANGLVEAVPGAYGGLGGETIHALSVGNVYRFNSILSRASPSLRSISLIGSGGVSSRIAALRFAHAGASIVGIATALGRDGLEAFSEVAGGPVEENKFYLPPGRAL